MGCDFCDVRDCFAGSSRALDIGAQTHADFENLLTIAERGIKVLAGAVVGREASVWSLIVKGGSKWWGRISRIGISAEVCSDRGQWITVDVFSGILYASYDRRD